MKNLIKIIMVTLGGYGMLILIAHIMENKFLMAIAGIIAIISIIQMVKETD